MTLMPEVHDALARAVATRSEHRRWWRPSRPLSLILAGVLVVSGSAFAATTGWHPTLGSDKAPRPLPAKSDVPADQLAALAVLRRPQTDADRGPLVEKLLRVLTRNEINGIHVDGIRVLFRNSRELVVLVPAQRFRMPGPQTSTSVQNVLCLVSTAYNRPQTIWTHTKQGVRKASRIPGGFNYAGFNCGDMDVLRSTGIQTATPTDGSGPIYTAPMTNISMRRIVLVPDGVAKVGVRLRGNTRLMVPVDQNVHRYTTKGSPFQTVSLWFDAAGNRIDHKAPKNARPQSIGMSAPLAPLRH